MIKSADSLKNPDKYKEMGAKAPHGAILSGKPGNINSKAIAGEAKCHLFPMSGSEFVELFAVTWSIKSKKII